MLLGYQNGLFPVGLGKPANLISISTPVGTKAIFLKNNESDDGVYSEVDSKHMCCCYI